MLLSSHNKKILNVPPTLFCSFSQIGCVRRTHQIIGGFNVIGGEMNDPFGIIIFSLGLLFFLFQAFIVWFKPKDYLKDIHERKIWFKTHFSFFPDWFIGYIFFFEKPLFNIWWGRVLSLIAVLLCIISVIVAIRGPF